MTKSTKPKMATGTKEWANSNVNLYLGCSHDCKYCYAKKMSIRFGRSTNETWKKMRINLKVIEKKYGKRKGRIMFPSTHDITPETLLPNVIVLNQLLLAGNEILITTKPHFSVIKFLVEHLPGYKNQIQFRFTIGSISNKTLSFWEPGAPNFVERLQALAFAFHNGYKTSISIEPILSSFHLDELIETLDPFVTDTIWLGTMNYISRKVPLQDLPYYEDARIIRNRTYLETLYETYKNNPKIRWKDSIKKILGLSQTLKPVISAE